MNYIKNYLLAFAITSAPLMGMEYAVLHQRTNPCITITKAVAILGSAYLFLTSCVFIPIPETTIDITNPDPTLTSLHVQYPLCPLTCLTVSKDYFYATGTFGKHKDYHECKKRYTEHCPKETPIIGPF